MKYSCTLLLLLIVLALSGQTGSLDSVLLLPQATVVASPFDAFQENTPALNISESRLRQNRLRTLTELLEGAAPVYIRNYGPGMLATPSIRGGSASQTSVLWNGFDLQSNSLGLTDLSLLPVFFFDQVSVHPGAHSALWGSGSVGGNIQLDTRNDFSPQTSLSYLGRLGSFGQQGHGLSLQGANGKMTFDSRLFYQRADNDFDYTDYFGEEVRQPHAHTYLLGGQQKMAVRWAGGHQLSATAWWQRAGREIPPLIGQSRSLAEQTDRELRTSLQYRHLQANGWWEVRAAWLDYKNDYEDALVGIDTRNRSRAWRLESDRRFDLGSGRQFQVGMQWAQLSAGTDTYQDARDTRMAALLNYAQPIGKGRVVLSVRQAYAQDRLLWPVPALNLSIPFNKNWKGHVGIQRSFRLPTFNDRFWQPGGQPELNPEQGWSQEAGVQFEQQRNNRRLGFYLTGYNRLIKNWILWQPAGSIWIPQNVDQVWSRGADTRAYFDWKKEQLLFRTEVQYELTFATRQGPAPEFEREQLIYTPVHQGRINSSVGMGDWMIAWQQERTGRVFLVADNSRYLQPVYLHHLQIERHLQVDQMQLNIRLSVHNLFNADYQRVGGRPMPGRWFEAAIKSNLIFKNKKSRL